MGLRRAKGEGRGYEGVVTSAMRGEADEPMTEGTAIPLLERISGALDAELIVEISPRAA